MTGKPQTGVPHAAGVLGFAGALPFVALTGSSFYDNVNVSLQSIEILRLYGALILSFLGGIHWGLALAAPALSRAACWRRYGVSLVPARGGWAAMLLPTYRGLIALALGFAILLVYDLYAAGLARSARLVSEAAYPPHRDRGELFGAGGVPILGPCKSGSYVC